MKALLATLIAVSLVTGAMAQQEQATPPPKGKTPPKERAAREPQAQKEARPERQLRTATEPKAAKEIKANPTAERPRNGRNQKKVEPKAATQPVATPDSAATTPMAEPATKGKGQADRRRNGGRGPAKENAVKTASPAPAATAESNPAANPSAANPAVTQPKLDNRRGPKRNPEAKKPDVQVVQKIRSEHESFKAQPQPEKVPTVTFNKSYRIHNSEQWKGEQYGAFRSYRPERHDQGWYRSHYDRVEVIGGGAYYWNNGYWYPAWGYDNSAQYYPYDGPIYVGSHAEPPDRVIADVQAVLQESGYYKGEVDGLLGPLTRQALTDYQADNGLYTTAAIDEPTLASLDLG